MYVCMYGHHIKQSTDQPGKVANPARGQLNRKMNIPLSSCVPDNLVYLVQYLIQYLVP